MPTELLDQIASYLEDHEVVLLSLTCRNMYNRLKQPCSKPSLDKEIAVVHYYYAFTPGTVVMFKTRFW
ncbi:hypothetical protein BKA65DRAFT_546639 [Rhexocercosporidium sp. MPI-PUGE-AT-0058]|nr:hypothetical protein BKA65DRAFT_546639 [Rhexocercosporidium sp. MPI-PUGE-AT-0058]